VASVEQDLHVMKRSSFVLAKILLDPAAMSLRNVGDVEDDCQEPLPLGVARAVEIVARFRAAGA
jgi:hypothetical protein